MEFILNPIVISVVVLCALCLARVNVLLALIAASLVAGLTGGLGLTKSMELLSGGFSANATTALSYILLGTFAVAIAHTGLMQMLVRWIGAKMGGRPLVFCFGLAFIACLSQNVVPVHIAFIPLLIPPLLKLMNKMKLDRRAVSCALGFGLTAPYVSLPIGFGLIFQGIVAQSMTQNGMAVTVADVASVAWIAGLSMVVGLVLAVFYFTRRPRTYLDKPVVGVTESDEEIRFGLRHWVTLGAIVAAVAVQIMLESLPLAALLGLIIMLAGGAFQFKKLDDHIASGISMMGFIAFVMLIAGGYAAILKETGAVNSLIEGVVPLMGESKWVAATIITLIGLLVVRHGAHPRRHLRSALHGRGLLRPRHDPPDDDRGRPGRRGLPRLRLHSRPHVRPQRRRPAQPHLGHLRADLPRVQRDASRGRHRRLAVHLTKFHAGFRRE